METLTSLERSLRAINHQRPDRIPVIPQAHGWVLLNSGHTVQEFMHNGKLFAEMTIKGWQDFGYDGVFVGTDSVALAQQVGLDVEYTDFGPVANPEGMLKDYNELDSVHIPNLHKTRLNEWLIATQILKKEIGDQVLIIARGDQGAFTLAGQLRGMQKFLTDIATGEEDTNIHRLLQFCNDYILAFCKLLYGAGAHVVTIGDALASGSLISPSAFEKYAFPYQLALAKEIRKGSGYFGIHVCGNTTRIMNSLVATTAHMIEFDAPTDFKVAWEAARNKVCLLGNVDTSETMLFGSPQKVDEECRWRIEMVKPDSGFILSSGCVIPPNAPVDNLRAMIESAKKYGRYAS
jgi:MtaA/CmuA family methyltransferase